MKSIEEMMAMDQRVQAELKKAQEGLDTIEGGGAAGGGMVKVKASAKGRIIGVEIDDSLMQPSEKQMLEDLIAAAINDARTKADLAADVVDELGVTGGGAHRVRVDFERSEEHTSVLQFLLCISYFVFCLYIIFFFF